jgi:hypothetical protein
MFLFQPAGFFKRATSSHSLIAGNRRRLLRVIRPARFGWGLHLQPAQEEVDLVRAVGVWSGQLVGAALAARSRN